MELNTYVSRVVLVIIYVLEQRFRYALLAGVLGNIQPRQLNEGPTRLCQHRRGPKPGKTKVSSSVGRCIKCNVEKSYLTLRPELAVIGLAVIAVLGVLNACSIDCDIAA